MKNIKHDIAPRWPKKLVEWYCGPSEAEDLIGDIEELYIKNVLSSSRWKARLKYTAQCLSLLFSYAVSARKRTVTYSTSQNSIAMYSNYFKVAIRSLRKHKFFTIINIIGLSVGMSIGLLAVAAFVDILTVDDFHENKEKIYRVISRSNAVLTDPDTYKWASVPEPLGYELSQGYQGVDQVVRFNTSINGVIENSLEELPVYGYFTDANFFDVFGYTLESGNPKTALVEPFSVVLTKKAADKFFHGKNPIGEELILKDQGVYKVTGVLNPSPRSHLLFEILGSYSTLPLISSPEKMIDWEDIKASYSYVLLENSESKHAVNQSLSKLTQRVYSGENTGHASFELQAIGDIPMSNDFYNEIGIVWGWPVMVLFFVIAFLILIPACFNYANLSISRSIMRSKEIGLRKVVGGQRSQIFTQFLVESCLLTFVSLLGSMILFRFAREEFIQMIVYGQKSFDFELDPLTLIGFLFFALTAGAIAGLAPALYFSRLSPLQTLRASSTPSKLKRFNVRRILTIGQFALSLFFIMGIAIILKQYRYALNYNFGFNQENILDVQLLGVDPSQFKTELEKIPEIQHISFSSHIAGTHESSRTYVEVAEASDSLMVYQMQVDHEYIPNLNLELVAGSNFAEISTTEESSIIVNERYVKNFQIASPHAAVGREFMIEGKLLTIIGVVKDFNYMALRNEIEPFIFRKNMDRIGYANVRLTSNDMPKSIAKIEKAWLALAQDKKFEAKFMEDEIEEAMISFQSMIKIFGSLGLLSIVVSCLGLLGMVVFTVENKIKEVGVRKVLGASVSQLIFSLSKDFLKFLVYAAIITTPIAYFAFDKIFLSMQHFRANIGFTEVALSILTLFVIGLVTVLSQTLKAANANPVDTLRYE